MNYLMIVLRLLHIISGVFWVGAALMLTFFISPTVGATKEAGQGFMRHFMRQTKFNLVMWTAALTTVIAGQILYWIDSDGFTSAWMHSGPGIGFGVAAGFAFLGLIAGVFQGRNSNAMAQLGGQIQAQGTPPSPEQASRLQSLGKALAIGGMLNATFLILATVGMAIARYLRF
ncbi:MAG: hypothetical protein JW963_18920 [Anaerolineales bacterium]|nr:hypothetical protein [Anaerolineales bacterium]